MKDYTEIIKALRNCVNDGCEDCDYFLGNRCREMQEKAADAIEALTAELRNCRDELCLRCGNYKEAHKGACDGCRWKDVG